MLASDKLSSNSQPVDKTIWADHALLADGWARGVRVGICQQGQIVFFEKDQAKPEAQDYRAGVLLPAPVNVHSHAFQRAMAGLTEYRSVGDGAGGSDSFWTWRQLMYRFLNRMTPDHVEAVAAFVQMEMLEAGYACNVEFHYVHHQPDGTPYGDIAELANRITAASVQAGIGLTLLPVHYQYGGCDHRALQGGQRRFGNDIDRFYKLYQVAKSGMSELPADAAIGVAPHSLRAIDCTDINRLYEIDAGQPIHMHLAEQLAEVTEVENALGARPVDWLLDNTDVNSQWCLIHCTQMTASETTRLGGSGAVAGLCPITESNLGDGIFNGVSYLNAGGAIAIGSDSNIRISLSEELRTLDYSQRLRDHSRAALATTDKSTGRRLYDSILAGGAQAAARQSGAIAVGMWADLLTLDHAHVDLFDREGDTLIDCFAFAGDDRMVKDVWSAGRHLVSDGVHTSRDEIVSRYRSVIAELGGSL